MMKSTFTSLLLMGLLSITTSALAQTKNVSVASGMYEALKEAGELGDYSILFEPTANPINRQNPISSLHRSGGGGFGCGILVDSTELQVPHVSQLDVDDGSFGPIQLPFEFCFYGTPKNSFYLNANGNISFDAGYGTFSSESFPANTFSMVAPFWGDVDLSGTNNGSIAYEVGATYAIIRWQSVGYYNEHYDKLNDFQLIITDGVDGIIPGGNNIAFIYGDMQWTTGDASQGINGFGGIPATVGANQGDGVNFFQIGRFDSQGSAYDGPFLNNDGVDWLDYQYLTFDVCPPQGSTNIQPIFDSPELLCDTVVLCQGDTFNFDFSFFSPEQDQITTVEIDTSEIDGFVLLNNNSGNLASVQAQIVGGGGNAGLNTVVFIATDDGTPAQTDTITIIFDIRPVLQGSYSEEETCDTEFNLTGNGNEVPGEWSYTAPIGAMATFTPSTSSFDASVAVSNYGEYTFIFLSDDCGQRDTVTVEFNPTPLPVDLLDQTVCPGTDVSFDALNEDIGATYLWTPGDSTSQVFDIDSILTTTDIEVAITNQCGTANGSATVVVHALSVSGPSDICLSEEAALVATSSTPTGAWTYEAPENALITFDPDSQSQTTSVSFDLAGSYEFIFTEDNCNLTDSVALVVIPPPSVEIFADTNRICTAGELTIYGNSGTFTSSTYSWSPSGFMDSTLVVQGPNHDQYIFLDPMDSSLVSVTLIVENVCGSDTGEFPFQIISCNDTVPTVFNPLSTYNGGVNSYFNIPGLEYYPGNKVLIFDRWGRKMYEEENYHNNPWDGDGSADGVYYYIVTRPGQDPKKGFVHLTRRGS